MLADVKRCLLSSTVLELSPGAAFHQSTHAVLLQGSLVADAPAELGSQSALASPRISFTHSHRRTRSTEGGLGWPARPVRSSDGGPVPSGGGSSTAAHLRRISATAEAEAAWEAAALAAAAAPQAPRVLPWLCCARFRCNAGAGGQLPEDRRWRAGPEGALLLVCLTESGEVPAGVADAEAEAAAAHAAAELLAAQQAAAFGLKSHPVDMAAADQAPQQPGAAASEAVPAAAAGGLRARPALEARPTFDLRWACGVWCGRNGCLGQGWVVVLAVLQHPPVPDRVAACSPPCCHPRRRLMPWQHRWQQPRSRPVPTADDAAGDRSGGDINAPPSSRDASSHGGLARLFSGAGQ